MIDYSRVVVGLIYVIICLVMWIDYLNERPTGSDDVSYMDRKFFRMIIFAVCFLLTMMTFAGY